MKKPSPEEELLDRVAELFRQLETELDLEYQALQKGETARLASTRLRQEQLQKQLTAAAGKLNGARGRAKLAGPCGRLAQKLTRNLELAQQLRDAAAAELKELGKIRRIQRQFLPKKVQKNTPVLLDIRR